MLLLIISALLFQNPAWNVDKNGLAIEGYDPVSYFQGVAKEGAEDISYQYKGVTFYFSSLGNKNTFKVDPESYLPQYGGYCAYAMGTTGEKVGIDPETFKIVDGELYLFYNSWGNNTKEPWDKDENVLKNTADTNWKIILGSNN